MTEQALSRKGTYKRHFYPFVLDRVTQSRHAMPRTAIRDALDALFPASLNATGETGKPLYDGLHGDMARLLNGRATLSALRRWRLGNRGAPNWFVATLRDRLVQRRAEIDSAIAGLDSLPERPGRGAGLKQYWRDKKRREIEEQTARERARR